MVDLFLGTVCQCVEVVDEVEKRWVWWRKGWVDRGNGWEG